MRMTSYKFILNDRSSTVVEVKVKVEVEVEVEVKVKLFIQFT